MKLVKLIVIRTSDNKNLGTLEMRETRFYKLAAFDDNVNKPLNLTLTDNEIEELREQHETDIASGPAFFEDDEVTLEIA